MFNFTKSDYVVFKGGKWIFIISLFWIISPNLFAETVNCNQIVHLEQKTGSFYHQESYASLVLAPDSKTLYGLHKKGLLVQYQIKPFKKLQSINLSSFNTDYKCYVGSSMHITSDGKRLVISNYLNALLIDLVNKKLVTKINFTEHGYGAFLAGELFVVMIPKAAIKKGDIGKIKFKVFSAYDLSEVKSLTFKDPNIPNKSKLQRAYQSLLISKKNRLVQIIVPTGEAVGPYYLIKGHKSRLVIFEKSTLKPIFIAKFKKISGWYDPPTIRYSYDLKKIYLQEAEPFVQEEAFEGTGYKTLNNKGNVEIELETLRVRNLSQSWREIEDKTLHLRVVPAKAQATSQTNDFITFGSMLSNTRKRSDLQFVMFDDGEAIFVNRKTRKIAITKMARPHMKMIIDGEVCPMNDVTFKNYIDTKNEL